MDRNQQLAEAILYSLAQNFGYEPPFSSDNLDEVAHILKLSDEARKKLHETAWDSKLMDQQRHGEV